MKSFANVSARIIKLLVLTAGNPLTYVTHNVAVIQRELASIQQGAPGLYERAMSVLAH